MASGIRSTRGESIKRFHLPSDYCTVMDLLGIIGVGDAASLSPSDATRRRRRGTAWKAPHLDLSPRIGVTTHTEGKISVFLQATEWTF